MTAVAGRRKAFGMSLKDFGVLGAMSSMRQWEIVAISPRRFAVSHPRFDTKLQRFGKEVIG